MGILVGIRLLTFHRYLKKIICSLIYGCAALAAVRGLSLAASGAALCLKCVGVSLQCFSCAPAGALGCVGLGVVVHWPNYLAACVIFYLFYLFIFYLWWILSYIEMKQPRVYMCSPSQSPLPPPSPPAPSRFSQCTRSERLSHASNLGW